jgi:hypothetical protein
MNDVTRRGTRRRPREGDDTMILQLDTTAKTANLADLDDTGGLSVRLDGPSDAGDIYEALASKSLGMVVGPDIWVSVHRLEELAEGQVGADWGDRFAQMLTAARSAGGLNDDGSYLRSPLP